MFKVISCASKLHADVSTGCFIGFVYFVFGCKAFALLFYDIDPELSTSDKGAFQSSACAEVWVINEVLTSRTTRVLLLSYRYMLEPILYLHKFCIYS